MVEAAGSEETGTPPTRSNRPPGPPTWSTPAPSHRLEGKIPDGAGSRVGYSGDLSIDRRDIELTVEATSSTRV